MTNIYDTEDDTSGYDTEEDWIDKMKPHHFGIKKCGYMNGEQFNKIFDLSLLFGFQINLFCPLSLSTNAPFSFRSLRHSLSLD